MVLVPLLSATGDDDLTIPCATELAACQEADMCVTYIHSIDDKDTEIDPCGAALGLEFSVSSPKSCDAIGAVSCCLDDNITDDECLHDSAFVE